MKCKSPAIVLSADGINNPDTALNDRRFRRASRVRIAVSTSCIQRRSLGRMEGQLIVTPACR